MSFTSPLQRSSTPWARPPRRGTPAPRTIALAALAAIWLSACGGGGGSGDAVETTDTIASASTRAGLSGPQNPGAAAPSPDNSPPGASDGMSPGPGQGQHGGPPPGAAPDTTPAESTFEPFRVNTTTAGEQKDPDIARLSDGSYVVVWISGGVNAPLNGVFMQRFDAIGNPIAGETRVDEPVAGRTAVATTVTVLSGGDFVVTSRFNGASDISVVVRRYQADGTALFSREDKYLTVGDAGTVAQPDGGFVRWVFAGEEGRTRLVLQRLRADNTEAGTPVDVDVGGGERLYGLADGTLALLISGDSQVPGIYLQRYTPDGAALGNRVPLVTQQNFTESFLTALSGGGYALAWTRAVDNQRIVVTRAFAVDGTPAGAEQQADAEAGVSPPPCYPSQFGTVCPSFPNQIAVLASPLQDGGYLVSWTSSTRGGEFVRRFSASGAPVGEIQPLPIPMRAELQQLSTGEIVGVWQASDGDQTGVFGRHFRSAADFR